MRLCGNMCLKNEPWTCPIIYINCQIVKNPLMQNVTDSARSPILGFLSLCCFLTIELLSGCASQSHSLPSSESNAIHASGSEMPLPLAAFRQEGYASLLDPALRGTPTASGETYDPEAFTAAHPTLPFNTFVKVTNLSNNLTVTVRINDRGPSTKRRIIDLSYAAAQQIGLLPAGTARVELVVVQPQP